MTDPTPIAPTATIDSSFLAMLRALLRETGDYGRDLARLFAAELGENLRSVRYLIVMAGAAALLLTFSFLFLSLALIGAISYGLASWRWALLIVGVAYGLIGLLLMVPLAHALSRGALKLEHTRRRLREDAAWVKQKLAA